MGENNGGMSCSLGCWLLAAGAGFLTFVMLLLVGNAGLMQAIFLGGLAFVLLGLLFSWLFCSALPKPGDARSDATAATGDAATAGVAAAAAGAAVAAGAAKGSASDADASASAASSDSASSDQSAAGGASGDTGSAEAFSAGGDAAGDAGSGASAEAAASGAGEDAGAAAAQIKPSAKLAGEEDLASRKGTWRYEGGDASSDADSGSASSGGAADASGDDAGSAGAAAEPAAADTSANALGEDYDKDGILEGTDEGTRPEALDGPRGGKADNLKEIKGIGPKLEKLCNRLGFYHFDQIANWTDDEVAWVNANLEGFKGRVSRDQWVAQAKILAAGGETEFSKRVDDGKVY